VTLGGVRAQAQVPRHRRVVTQKKGTNHEAISACCRHPGAGRRCIGRLAPIPKPAPSGRSTPWCCAARPVSRSPSARRRSLTLEGDSALLARGQHRSARQHPLHRPRARPGRAIDWPRPRAVVRISLPRMTALELAGSSTSRSPASMASAPPGRCTARNGSKPRPARPVWRCRSTARPGPTCPTVAVEEAKRAGAWQRPRRAAAAPLAGPPRCMAAAR